MMQERHRSARRLCLCCALAAAVTGARTAAAHSLKLFATAEGDTLRGYAYLAGGERLRDVTVAVFAPDGEKLGQTKTDEKGEFSFTTTCRCDHLLAVDTGDGHAARFVVKADELGDYLPARGGAAGAPAEAPAESPAAASPGENPAAPDARTQYLISKTLGKQLRPLREQMDRLEQGIRLRDIIGGVGYIFGAAGVAMYFLARRKVEKARACEAAMREQLENLRVRT